MKTISLLFISVLLATLSNAQSVGITNDGLPPYSSAMLDIRHPNKGLLLPRTGSTDISTIPSPAVSLLVYNTATNGSGSTAVTPGYYYWSGSA